ncbi:biotin carboxyl carrier protein [Thermoflexales bacterium]|nr:biotin carboxyl carrier protein [Thermoflexales bacterium]
MEIHYQADQEVVAVQIEPHAEGYHITIGDRTYDVRVECAHADEISFTLDGQRHTAYVARDGSTRYVSIAGAVFELRQPDPRRARQKQHPGEDNLSAAMPGQITKVLVSAGDTVQRGQPLLVLEAMKMEIKITASHDGRVARVLVKSGQVVDRGQSLIELTG